MPHRTPQPDPDAPLAIPEPLPADYSDEVSKAQVEALRRAHTQVEAEMGPLVHEFRW